MQVGLRQYFADGWNTFDFLVVCMSVPGVVVDWCVPRPGPALCWAPCMHAMLE